MIMSSHCDRRRMGDVPSDRATVEVAPGYIS